MNIENLQKALNNYKFRAFPSGNDHQQCTNADLKKAVDETARLAQAIITELSKL